MDAASLPHPGGDGERGRAVVRGLPRVKTCMTILQRVRRRGPAHGEPRALCAFQPQAGGHYRHAAGPKNEDARQTALGGLAESHPGHQADCQDEDLRIIVKSQQDLWADGVRAGKILGDAEAVKPGRIRKTTSGEEAEEHEAPDTWRQ